MARGPHAEARGKAKQRARAAGGRLCSVQDRRMPASFCFLRLSPFDVGWRLATLHTAAKVLSVFRSLGVSLQHGCQDVPVSVYFRNPEGLYLLRSDVHAESQVRLILVSCTRGYLEDCILGACTARFLARSGLLEWGLYGLKQASCSRHQHLIAALKRLGLGQCGTPWGFFVSFGAALTQDLVGWRFPWR